MNKSTKIFDFNELYKDYRQKFLLIAKMYVHDDLVAEDIVTESFINFWEKQETLSIDVSPASYVLGTVKNKCLMYLREQKIKDKVIGEIAKRWDYEQNIAVLEDPEVNRKLFSSEVATIYREVLRSFSERQRSVFLASRHDGLTYIQISEKFDLTPRQVTRDIQKVLAALREALKDYLPLALILTYLNNI